MVAVAMVVHQEGSGAGDLAHEIAQWLIGNGHEVRIPDTDVPGCPALAEWAAPAASLARGGLQLALSVGGDGTMLRAVHLVVAGGVPVLGINLGHLGYLTEVEPGAWRPALERFMSGDYRAEERMTLQVDVHRSGGTSTSHCALNDTVVEKSAPGRTVRLGVSIDERQFLSYAADGVIVATPTGSTAYNLSAGGPIVSPRLSALVLTPVAPHLLFDRSMVLAPDESVRLEVLGGRAGLAVDGHSLGGLEVGDFLRCSAGVQPARLVTFGDNDFRQVLKAKFGLNSTASA